MSFVLQQVTVRYREQPVLHEVSTEFRPGVLTAIVGPNGAGKSTLLGVMAGLRRDFSGTCEYGGVNIRKWSRSAFAKSVCLVPQSLHLEFPFTVEQVVMMGRAPHAGRMFESDEDHAATERAMGMTDTLSFRDRDFRSLSGGERQRAVLASALAQSPEFLLLDEPATFLDLRHQVGIYRLVREFCRTGVGAVTVTHDLNTALTYADRVLILDGGRIVGDGLPADVLSPVNIESVFGVRSEAGGGSRPWIAYEP